MLSIGEFSNICKVSAKTLRHYAKIGLILPEEINPENGYRYYSIEQLETMLFINRLKSYHFSLEEIKAILKAKEPQNEILCRELSKKKTEMEKQARQLSQVLKQIEGDISAAEQGKSIMSYLDRIDVRLVEVPEMQLLSVRKTVHQSEFPGEYQACFGEIFCKLQEKELTHTAPPMVLFHSREFGPSGLDTEFAVPVKECVTGTRTFCPGLCLKTVLSGSYSGLPSVYAKQREWAEQEGYGNDQALFEVYVTDPSSVSKEEELVTEIYYPVYKKQKHVWEKEYDR